MSDKKSFEFDPYISKKDIEKTQNLTISLTLANVSSAIRFHGHLQELGLDSHIDDSHEEVPNVTIKCKGQDIDRINFAMYLTQMWFDA